LGCDSCTHHSGGCAPNTRRASLKPNGRSGARAVHPTAATGPQRCPSRSVASWANVMCNCPWGTEAVRAPRSRRPRAPWRFSAVAEKGCGARPSSAPAKSSGTPLKTTCVQVKLGRRTYWPAWRRRRLCGCSSTWSFSQRAPRALRRRRDSVLQLRELLRGQAKAFFSVPARCSPNHTAENAEDGGMCVLEEQRGARHRADYPRLASRSTLTSCG